MRTAYDVVLKPVITEESMSGVANKRYVFDVATDANKIEIARAVEEIFGVKVKKVNTINCKGKGKRVGVHFGYTASRKKAVVTLTEDSKAIEIFEGMM